MAGVNGVPLRSGPFGVLKRPTAVSKFQVNVTANPKISAT
jgi:hypothetical protein